MGFKSSLRTRITTGLLFLLGIIILISGVSVFYLTSLSTSSNKILKENYQTLFFIRHLTESFQGVSSSQLRYVAQQGFNYGDYKKSDILTVAYIDSLYLTVQSEEEKIYLDSLSRGYDKLVKDFDETRQDATVTLPNMSLYYSKLRLNFLPVREYLDKLREINQNKVIEKNDSIQKDTEEALLYMAIIGGFCVLITVGFIFYFPVYLTKPLNDLRLAIEQMSKKDYSARLHVGSTNEFAKLATSFNKMSKKIAEFESINLGNLLIEKRRTEAIIEHLQDGIIGISAQNKIIFMNQVAEILLDMSEEEAVDVYIPDLLVNNDILYHIMVDLMEVSKGKLFAEKTVKIPSSDRDLFFSRQVISLPETEDLSGFIIILKNVTKFTEMDAAKTHFIATISHELKTPLAATRLSIDLLRDKRIGELNEDQDDLVGDIEQATERLFALTGEILQLSQIEAGKIKINLQPVELESVLSYVMQAVKVAAEQKRVTIEADIATNLSIFFADIDKLKWVIINFLTNAIRYAPTKSKVKLSIFSDEGGITFSVSDKGKGIAEMYHLKVFEKYFQVPEPELEGDKKGSGLGLAICREFIEAHKGEIWVESQPEQGATFSFWLPSDT
ncbi:ATP-binding protein [Bernardetia sp.]|uniref:HAMP domain-containing sensor histidine kinase n=1 Tax=Bernardetia sp. TaxID=1937974 RepID=UPI0025BCC0AC|nr:ATP-binding protein [Bernardetia sp.]